MQRNNGSNGLPPPLVGSATELTSYKLVEWWLRSIWLRHSGRINGSPPDKPFILVANHGSYLDWMLLHVLIRNRFRRNIRFFAKRKVVENRWLKLAIKAASPIVVEARYADRCLAVAARELEANKDITRIAMCVFPERGRSRMGEQLKNAPGAAWLARQCQVPIVPVALCGFWEVWPPQKRLPAFKHHGLSVNFLPPVNPSDFGDDQETVDCAMNHVYEIVRRDRAERLQPNGK